MGSVHRLIGIYGGGIAMKRTTGTIISAKRQWWLKVNKKAVRFGPMDGAAFPYIIKVRYVVDGKEYVKRKWIGTEYPVPVEGDTVQIAYEENNPEKMKVVY
jgi:hypothetical protein